MSPSHPTTRIYKVVGNLFLLLIDGGRDRVEALSSKSVTVKSGSRQRYCISVHSVCTDTGLLLFAAALPVHGVCDSFMSESQEEHFRFVAK